MSRNLDRNQLNCSIRRVFHLVRSFAALALQQFAVDRRALYAGKIGRIASRANIVWLAHAVILTPSADPLLGRQPRESLGQDQRPLRDCFPRSVLIRAVAHAALARYK